MIASPIQAAYEIGQKITCSADANPEATFTWKSHRTSELWYSDTFEIREDMVGRQLMSCFARNTIYMDSSIDANTFSTLTSTVREKTGL